VKRQIVVSAVLSSIVIAAAGCSGNSSQGPPLPAATPSMSGATPASTTPMPSRPTVQPVPPGRAGVPAAGLVDPRTVNQSSVNAVASAALTATYRMDTAIDHSPRDAALRAKPFLSVALANELAQPMPGGGGAEWNTWALHRAYTKVLAITDVTEAGAPPDSATQAARTLQVTYQAVGRDSWRGPKLTSTAFLALERSSKASPWRLSAVEGD
jgi:hypothetical protein